MGQTDGRFALFQNAPYGEVIISRRITQGYSRHQTLPPVRCCPLASQNEKAFALPIMGKPDVIRDTECSLDNILHWRPVKFENTLNM